MHAQMLLGAMEQQEVAVAKAGMCATLPARTTIIAAANPVGGTWQSSKTLLENLKLSPGLLSRFDLAFVMLDCPDRQHDAHLSEQVLAKHAGGSVPALVCHRRALHSTCNPARCDFVISSAAADDSSYSQRRHHAACWMKAAIVACLAWLSGNI